MFGADEEDHDKNLHHLMKRAEENGLIFNPEKCKIKEESIAFLGIIYSKHGVRPDPSKMQGICDLAIPHDKTKLHTFLGMATYLLAFILNLSSHTVPLHKLLQKD